MPPIGGATLTWIQNTEPDLAGYKIYTGTSPGVYGSPLDVGLTATPTTPAYSFQGIAPHGTRYFAITAYDTSANESTKSTEVSKFVNPVIFIG